MRHERQKLFPPCSVAVCHHCRAAIHPCRGWMADSGQRDDLSSSVGKLDCLRGYRWTCVDRFRRITPGLSKVGELTDRLAQMRQDGGKASSPVPGSRPSKGEGRWDNHRHSRVASTPVCCGNSEAVNRTHLHTVHKLDDVGHRPFPNCGKMRLRQPTASAANQGHTYRLIIPIKPIEYWS